MSYRLNIENRLYSGSDLGFLEMVHKYKGVGVHFADLISFLAHLSRSEKVNFCDRSSSVVVVC